MRGAVLALGALMMVCGEGLRVSPRLETLRALRSAPASELLSTLQGAAVHGSPLTAITRTDFEVLLQGKVADRVSLRSSVCASHVGLGLSQLGLDDALSEDHANVAACLHRFRKNVALRQVSGSRVG
jgi:hypothetical protein